jgi:phosphatidate cytidylyltransferase
MLGLLGDLSISVLKRQVGVKDAGKLFPGHGGMLDRLDSALFVLPFIYQVAFWLTQ